MTTTSTTLTRAQREVQDRRHAYPKLRSLLPPDSAPPVGVGDPRLYRQYRLTIVVGRLTGGIPAHPKMLDAWLETSGKAGTPAGKDQQAANADLDPEVTHTVIFYRDRDGKPCYESRCFKAAFKEAANILKGDREDSLIRAKNYRSKVAERIFVGPPLLRITQPVHTDERPIQVMTMQGPRSSIKRFEYADDVRLTFDIYVLRDDVVTEDALVTMVSYLASNGIGADRSQGSGQFTIEAFDVIEE